MPKLGREIGRATDSMDFEYDVVTIDEFDALSIDLKLDDRHLHRDRKVQAFRRAHVGGDTASASASRQKYPAKAHARKVASELGVDNGLIYLPGEPTMRFEDSENGPLFHQRRYFYYLAGADVENCAVTYNIGEDKVILWIPYSRPREELYNGRQPLPSDMYAVCDVDHVRYTTGIEQFLSETLGPAVPLYVLRESQVPDWDNHHNVVVVDTAKLQPAMDRARVIKDEYEIDMMRRASAMTAGAHTAVLRGLLKMTNEREVDATFRAYCIANGARHQAYPVIAGSGPNASTLHYNDNNQPFGDRQLMVLDAAAEWKVYPTDVTRTFPLNGRWSKEAAEVYAVVERMQEECIEKVAPGMLYLHLQAHAEKVAAEELLRIGILRGEVEEILEAGTVHAFFPHGLGHHIGLELHDVLSRDLLASDTTLSKAGKRFVVDPAQGKIIRDPKALSSEMIARSTLRPGMVFSIEPGVYFNRAWVESSFLNSDKHSRFIDADVVEKYYDVGGCRIEDILVVTEDGYENLTTTPKGEEALKIIRGEA